MSDINRHKETFIEEAHELLAELETSLLELEGKPDNKDLIDSIFRALHTIKGSGSMFGFEEIAAFTHQVETVFDLVRNGNTTVSKELIDLILAARDYIKIILDDSNLIDKKRAGDILDSLNKLTSSMHDIDSPLSPVLPSSAVDGSTIKDVSVENLFRIRFRPYPGIYTKGIDPVLLLNELSSIGNCTVIAYADNIPPIEEINPESCYTHWEIILTTNHDINAVKDVFIFAEEECELNIDNISVGEEMIGEQTVKKIGQILIERGDISHEELKRALKKQKRVGEYLVEENVIDQQRIESALIEQQHIRELREKQKNRDSMSSIRVSSEKLDRLVDLVGELVTVQARLTQTTSSTNNADLILITEEVERLTEELRDNTMSIRMIPIGTMFSKYKRLVRDLSKDMGKEIEMTTDGAETELDKTVIEKLNDPLVHLIRNSIDHGIETPDIRKSLGKSGQGVINLSAKQSGADVLIEITDDGAGLDPAVIKAEAVEKGIVEPDSEMSEKDIFALILSPGFSTAKMITSVSGRGVGMDVVKRNLDALRGTIDINSRRGEGTTITLKLPLTLAIIDGLLVKIGEEIFVLPLSIVEECVELTREDVDRSHGRHIANVRGEIVPYISLREQFSISGSTLDIEQIVITEVDDQRVGFVVDSVIGEHQTVIKSLGRFYRDIEGLSGATILGDGTVALILDIPNLVQNIAKESVRTCSYTAGTVMNYENKNII